MLIFPLIAENTAHEINNKLKQRVFLINGMRLAFVLAYKLSIRHDNCV